MGRSIGEATHVGTGLPVLRAVRSARHPGGDRLVFEFDRAGLPVWQVGYVDRPVRDCGSGEPVAVAGNAWLRVRFSGAQAHTAAAEPTAQPYRRAPDHHVLKTLVRTCDFEGEVVWIAGVASPVAFVPRVLNDPARLVIDIAH